MWTGAAARQSVSVVLGRLTIISMAFGNMQGEFSRRAIVRYSPAAQTGDALQYPMLYGVMETSRTRFNLRQIEKLLEEVERLLMEKISPEQRTSLEAIRKLCEHPRRPHKFLWFVGDEHSNPGES